MGTSIARRSFIGGGTVALAACTKKKKKEEDSAPKGPRPGAPQEGQVAVPPPPVAAASMPMRKLGKTGVDVSIVGVGGFHLGMPKEDAEAVRIVRSALDRGIN